MDTNTKELIADTIILLAFMTVLVLILLSTGCSTQREWYKEQGWTPDSFNYTLQRDRSDGAMSDYWGLGWSLK